MAALAPATRATYSRAIKLYKQLTPRSVAQPFPVTQGNYLNFICQLYALKYAPSTITTFCAALSYVNKISNAEDPAKSFLIGKLLTGAKKTKPSNDLRQPITLNLLHMLVGAIPAVIASLRTVNMYRAVLLIMFHALLRVGEVTVRAKSASMINVIKFKDCNFQCKKGKPTLMVITIRNCKHHNNTNFQITIPAADHLCCPVQAVWKYGISTLHRESTLFHNEDGSPLTRHQFDKTLRALFQATGLNTAQYKTHSFRIGAATEALTSMQMSDAEVQHLGRWHSDAFKRYIRSPSFLKPAGRRPVS